LSRLDAARRGAARRALVVLASVAATTGCWEQWSDTWWPQMKWQKAVQAYELQGAPWDEDRQLGNFVPPEGTVPVGQPRLATHLSQAEGDRLPNPVAPTLASLENGREQYRVFCAVCHGEKGLGDGPVAGPPYGTGPLVGVLPLAGPVGKALTSNFSDGHIFWVISNGIRRMPSYQRIPERSRWDIVNYVRYLNDAIQAPAPATAAAAPAPAAPAPAAASAPGGEAAGGAGEPAGEGAAPAAPGGSN